MTSFGQTRSARRADHLLQTPDTFVRAPLPGMHGATAVVHASPALGAKFMEYTVEFEAGGTLPATPEQRFIYVLEGALESPTFTLTSDEYAWFPPMANAALVATSKARAVV